MALTSSVSSSLDSCWDIGKSSSRLLTGYTARYSPPVPLEIKRLERLAVLHQIVMFVPEMAGTRHLSILHFTDFFMRYR